MPVRPRRRLLAASVCAVAILLMQPAAVHASPADRGVRAGEPGSGPPTFPFVTPRSFAAAGASVRWSDVARDEWARTAIDFVGATNDWMRDYRAAPDGTYAFKPTRLESRRLFARSVVSAFAPDAQPDPSLTFTDVAATDRFYRWANVAVSNGWMAAPDGAFRPTDPVTVRDVHRALVLALGLGDLADGVDHLHLRDGTPVPTPPGLGTLLIGMRIGLRYNHSDESLDVGPDDPLPRDEVAWSLYRAATEPTWLASSLAAYADITLPNLSPRVLDVVAFGLDYVGYPYVWGGEWPDASPSGYCCGTQPRGGFDCSGLTWWLLKKQATGWDPTPPRPYAGWDLPQRTSAQMATVGDVTWTDIRPGDTLFYDGDGDGVVDHVDTYIGNGWALDSGSSNAGVTITRVANSWYEDHFVHARHVASKTA
jgi:cell wall-associated NlpC family hydrolase